MCFYAVPMYVVNFITWSVSKITPIPESIQMMERVSLVQDIDAHHVMNPFLREQKHSCVLGATIHITYIDACRMLGCINSCLVNSQSNAHICTLLHLTYICESSFSLARIFTALACLVFQYVV
jgi:hypothetical protein